MKSNRILMLAVALSVSMAAAFATEETILVTPKVFLDKTAMEQELNDLCGISFECRSAVVKFADNVGRIYVVQDLCEQGEKVEAKICINASTVVDSISELR